MSQSWGRLEINNIHLDFILLSGQRRIYHSFRGMAAALQTMLGGVGGSYGGGDAFGSTIFGGNQGINERQAQSSVLMILHGVT